MTARPGKPIRLELDERRARAVHAALREALNAQLLGGVHLAAAREVLDQLDTRVPGWLEAGPLGGEAGYVVAAEVVLRALVAAEDRGRSALSEAELLRDVADAKPLGSTASDVLGRMRREAFITVSRRPGDEPWITAASAGRRFLHRGTADRDDWVVRDPDALLDLIYAERHRPSVQAIGRLEARDLGELVDALISQDLLKAPEGPVSLTTWLDLTSEGHNLARERWKTSAPPGSYSLYTPTPPPRPFQRQLPLRIAPDDRVHPTEDGYPRCQPAAWLQRASKTKLFATLKRDGAVDWTCNRCARRWLVYLQAFTAAGEPAYAAPTAGAYNRALWRPGGWR